MSTKSVANPLVKEAIPPATTPQVKRDRTEGYKRSRIPWRWILLAALGLAIAFGILSQLLSAKGGLPEGLFQVNGRFEGDHVIVASKYPGRIGELLAREGDTVAAGQLLFRLSDDETSAKKEQMEAALNAAIAQAQSAKLGVGLAKQSGNASIDQARSVVDQSSIAIEIANVDVERANGLLNAAIASQGAAEANVASAKAGLDSANVNREKALSALDTAEAQLKTAIANRDATLSAVDASEATYHQALRERDRYATLARQGAVPSQIAERASTSASQADAQLQLARKQAEASQAAVEGYQAQVLSARDQIRSADAGIKQARASILTAEKQVKASQGAVTQAQAQRVAAERSVNDAIARKRQALGGLSQANTSGTQVAIDKALSKQADANVANARGALNQINSVLSAFDVKAPTAGTVMTRFQDQGELVSAGAPVLELVDLDRLYLKVYVPETMIGKVRIGLPAKIYTDTYPNEPFDATVGYIASQAEFTPKEIQSPTERVNLVYAVKLYLVKNPDHKLTPGLPADAVIRWKEGVLWAHVK